MVVPRRAAFAEESAEVEVLYANLDKMKSLTKKIQGSMTRLETSGKMVQDAIGPIYGNTQRLQTTNSNIDHILEAIGRIREPLDMRNREERILRSPPQRVGLGEYIASIDRTNQALRELKQSNLRSNQQAISELDGLLHVGGQQLEDVFRDILRQDAQPVEHLHFITKQLDFPRLPQNKTSQLRTINAHVASPAAQRPPSETQGTPTAKAYAEVRGQHLTLSLQNLATASISMTRKTSVGVLYKKDSSGIGTYARGIQGLYTAEYDNICPIFPREEWGSILSNTCQSSLNAFASTLRELDTHITENILTDCFLAYEIVEVVSNISYQLENRTGELKQVMSEALRPVRETAKSSLSTLLNDTRTRIQQTITLPADGAAVPITSETMTRLQEMTNYISPLSSILTSLGDRGWSTSTAASSSSSTPTLKSFDVGADGAKLFAHYASDMIDTVLSNLEKRASTSLRSKSLQGVFLANNVVIVDRMIRSSELQPLLQGAQPRLDAWRKKTTALYLDGWKETSMYLLDIQYTNRGARPSSTGTASALDSAAILKQLSSKDKDAIKEKFRSFNASFEELVAKHKAYKMEREVRQALGREVQMFLEALYGRFWDRYHDIDKGKGKYVKYDKGQLAAVLASLG
ncbi:exocyst complex component exo70 [Elasticomyces elasticus]|nr:exocyst complex component exo70 [Elasticomyces elasticus]